MRPAPLAPTAQVFVCTNARAASDPLASACGRTGPAVFAALKRAVLGSGSGARVWVTASGCLGQCPPGGCAAVVYPRNVQLVDVNPEDVPAIVRLALEPP